jgi:hypothetical protein
MLRVGAASGQECRAQVSSGERLRFVPRSPSGQLRRVRRVRRSRRNGPLGSIPL